MKFLKKKNSGDTTIRKVMDNEKSCVLCVVGMVEDLLKEDLLLSADLNGSQWLAISNCSGIPDHSGSSRQEALALFIEAGY